MLASTVFGVALNPSGPTQRIINNVNILSPTEGQLVKSTVIYDELFTGIDATKLRSIFSDLTKDRSSDNILYEKIVRETVEGESDTITNKYTCYKITYVEGLIQSEQFEISTPAQDKAISALFYNIFNISYVGETRIYFGTTAYYSLEKNNLVYYNFNDLIGQSVID